MSITYKTPEEIEILTEGGKRHARILETLAGQVRPGLSTADLDELARTLIIEAEGESAFLGYKPYGADRPFPAVVCVSINDAIVHGIPNEKPYIIENGDIVSIDLGFVYRGLITDSARTVIAGKGDPEAYRMLEVAEQALLAGLEAVSCGGRVGDIGQAIESVVNKAHFGTVRELAGHGVGYSVHEAPYVPNYGKKGTGEKIKEGMVFAIEPMITEGGEDIVLDADGYTYRTADGGRAVHVEDTVAIAHDGSVRILTRL